jgi:curved DNA-binding protein CbpA
MTDPFDLLGLPRRPLLSEEEIGTAYRKLAGKLHPDQEGGNELLFREMGEAAAILRNPALRLRELSSSPSGSQLPTKADELFPKIASMLKQADNLIEKKNAVSNALVKALLAAPLKNFRHDLESTLHQLQEWRTSLDRELTEIDLRWPEHDPDAISLLADSYAYAGRWESQLRERMLSLDCI